MGGIQCSRPWGYQRQVQTAGVFGTVPLPQPLTMFYVISCVITVYQIFVLATTFQKAGYPKAGSMIKFGSAALICDAVAHMKYMLVPGDTFELVSLVDRVLMPVCFQCLIPQLIYVTIKEKQYRLLFLLFVTAGLAFIPPQGFVWGGKFPIFFPATPEENSQVFQGDFHTKHIVAHVGTLLLVWAMAKDLESRFKLGTK